MKKLFLGVYNPSIILTYIGVFAAVAGMSLLLSSGVSALPTAMALLIFAGVCDLFDGAVARLCKRTEQEKQFGIQLDSLADTLSFVAFPILLLLTFVGVSPISVPLSCLYAFAGVMRLGWFNVTTEENRGFYQGLPVTFSALIFPVAYLVLDVFGIPGKEIIYTVLFGIIALLFILNFRLKKPGMKVAACLALLAIGVSVTLLLI